MADDFDVFLRNALAPDPREADRTFVARVQTGIVLEERLQAERSAFKTGLARQILAVSSLALGLVWLSRSPDLSGVIGDSPAIVLGVTIALFSLLVAVLGGRSHGASRRFSTR